MADTNGTIRSSLNMLLIILGMSALAVAGIVFIVVFAPGEQQASLIAAVLSVTVPVVATIILLVKTQEAARLAERAAIHARANAEHTQRVQTEVKALSVAVDGRLTQLIESLRAQAAMKQQVGHSEGLVEGHAAGLAEADALTAARAEVPPTVVSPPADTETEG